MISDFQKRVLAVVKKIPAGGTLTYQEVAARAGSPRASRAVGNLMKKNWKPDVPCHRVVRSNRLLGGYNKGELEKALRLLSEGAVGVMPTDTIYGLLGSALQPKVVERIYKLRKRDPKKPMIILISRVADLGKFNGLLSDSNQLKKLWPGAVSVILPLGQPGIKKFRYLHRGAKTLAFRLPKPKWLRDLLAKTGPLVAPSANIEGQPPAQTISQARRYFDDRVEFYLDAGRIKGRPSKLVKIEKDRLINLRK